MSGDLLCFSPISQNAPIATRPGVTAAGAIRKYLYDLLIGRHLKCLVMVREGERGFPYMMVSRTRGEILKRVSHTLGEPLNLTVIEFMFEFIGENIKLNSEINILHQTAIRHDDLGWRKIENSIDMGFEE